jgi:uncharacterized damage-inducible protein DinB
MKNSFKVTFLSLIFLSAYFVFGQKMAPPASPYISDLLAEVDYVQNQVIQLADAMPQEKYSWRPSEEVRSVSEVFMHIGGGDYFLLSMIGGSMPPDFKPEMEKSVTQKTEVIAFLKKAFEDAKNFITKIKEEDLDKPVDFFGNKTNERRILMLVLSHNSEHLGQSIAYARMNGVVPPWSKKE